MGLWEDRVHVSLRELLDNSVSGSLYVDDAHRRVQYVESRMGTLAAIPWAGSQCTFEKIMRLWSSGSENLVKLHRIYGLCNPSS